MVLAVFCCCSTVWQGICATCSLRRRRQLDRTLRFEVKRRASFAPASAVFQLPVASCESELELHCGLRTATPPLLRRRSSSRAAAAAAAAATATLVVQAKCCRAHTSLARFIRLPLRQVSPPSERSSRRLPLAALASAL